MGKAFLTFSVLTNMFGWLYILCNLSFFPILIGCLFFDISWKWLGLVFVTGAASKWIALR